MRCEHCHRPLVYRGSDMFPPYKEVGNKVWDIICTKAPDQIHVPEVPLQDLESAEYLPTNITANITKPVVKRRFLFG